MPKTKVTLLFQAGTVDSDGNAARVAGFSETLYASDDFESTILAARFRNLAEKRAALMPKNVRIIGSRFQQVDPVGGTRSFDNVYVGSSSAQNDLPQAALQWTVRAAGQPNQRSFILRGMPDARIVTGEYAPSDAFGAALQAYFTELTSYWRFRAIDRTVLPVKIATITNLGVMTTQTAHGLTAGDTVNIMTTKTTGDVSPQKLSYQAYVVSVAGLTAQLALPGRNDFILASAGGRARKIAITYPNFSITQQEVLAPTAITRKCGAPFRKFRGRRTAR